MGKRQGTVNTTITTAVSTPEETLQDQTGGLDETTDLVELDESGINEGEESTSTESDEEASPVETETTGSELPGDGLEESGEITTEPDSEDETEQDEVNPDIDELKDDDEKASETTPGEASTVVVTPDPETGGNTIKASIHLSVTAIREIMSENQELPLAERLKLIADNEDVTLSLRLLIQKLLTYADTMGKRSPIMDIQTIANKNYDLYTTLKAAINEQAYDLFKLKFDIINLVYKEYGNDAFSEHMLHRGDVQWKQGARSLATYQSLSTVIPLLCDMSKRDGNKKNIDFGKVFDGTKREFSVTAMENLKKYYNV